MSRRLRLLRRLVWLNIALSATCGTASARAQASAEVAPLEVELVVLGGPDAVARARLMADELSGRMPVAFRVRAARSAEEGPGHRFETAAELKIELDLRSLQQVNVVMFDASGARELARRSLPEASSLEVSAEAASYVLLTLLQSYSRERPSSSAPAPAGAQHSKPEQPSSALPAPARASQPAGPPQAASAKPLVLDLEGQARLAWLRADHTSLGFGLASSLGWTGAPVSPRLQALLVGYVPETLSQSELEAGWFVASLRVLPGLAVRVGSALTLSASVGGGVDWFRISPREDASSNTRGHAVARAGPVATACLGLVVPLVGASRFSLGASADLELAPVRYVADYAGERRTFLVHSALRPQLFGGLSFAFGSVESDQRSLRHRRALAAAPRARGELR